MVDSDARRYLTGRVHTEMSDDARLFDVLQHYAVGGNMTRAEDNQASTRVFSHACECDKVSVQKKDVGRIYVVRAA